MRCLIVEDDETIAAGVACALRRAGFVTERVADGENAWLTGGTEDWDIVVLDLGLPRLDGLTLLKRWRAEGAEMPVRILTARGSWSERIEASMPAPTTTCPSRSAWRSWSHGPGRWCGGRGAPRIRRKRSVDWPSI
nr:response regulator [Paracoccus beibuensis]